MKNISKIAYTLLIMSLITPVLQAQATSGENKTISKETTSVVLKSGGVVETKVVKHEKILGEQTTYKKQDKDKFSAKDFPGWEKIINNEKAVSRLSSQENRDNKNIIGSEESNSVSTSKATGDKYKRVINNRFNEDRRDSANSGMMSLWKLSFSAFFVLALLCGFLYLLKKFGAKYVGIKTDDIIRISSRVQLDSKNTLMMLRVYEDEILISIGPNGINLLSRFNQIENEDELIAEEKALMEKKVFEKVLANEIAVEEVK